MGKLWVCFIFPILDHSFEHVCSELQPLKNVLLRLTTVHAGFVDVGIFMIAERAYYCMLPDRWQGHFSASSHNLNLFPEACL